MQERTLSMYAAMVDFLNANATTAAGFTKLRYIIGCVCGKR